MNPDLFYLFGGILVALALVFSAIGIRGRESFPSRGAMAGTIALFVFGVVTTATWPVVSARDEQEHREAELAEERSAEGSEDVEAGDQPSSEAPEQPSGEGTEQRTPDQQDDPQGNATVVDVSSPEDGSLVFEPAELSAPAGPITISYDNPSLVPHSVAIEVDGETVDESDVVTQAKARATAELEPGEYVFYCTVPGHRDGGMEGTLTAR